NLEVFDSQNIGNSQSEPVCNHKVERDFISPTLSIAISNALDDGSVIVALSFLPDKNEHTFDKDKQEKDLQDEQEKDSPDLEKNSLGLSADRDHSSTCVFIMGSTNARIATSVDYKA